MSVSIESILIQVRAKLQENGIKLWLTPYYSNEVGPNDTELEVSLLIAFFFSSLFSIFAMSWTVNVNNFEIYF